MTKITDLTGAAPDAADVIPYVDVSDTTEDAAGTAYKATVAQIVAAGNPGYLPKTAGSGEGVTGTLYLDPGSDDNATVLKIPIVNDDGADFNFVINKTLFNTTEDTTFNWGFNNSGAGVEDASKHAWYLQLEYDYATAGNRYVEYHLNLFPPSGGNPAFRPFQYQYLTDGSQGSLFFRASNFYVSSIDGSQVLQFTTLDSSPKFRADSRVELRLPSETDAFFVYNSDTKALLSIDGVTSDVVFRGRILQFQDRTTNAQKLVLSSTTATFWGSTALGRLGVEMPSDSSIGFVVKGVASQTKDYFRLQDDGNAVQFAVGPTGQVKTNQASANTATPSGATAYQLPIYNAAGTLLGYIPVYGSAWT